MRDTHAPGVVCVAYIHTDIRMVRSKHAPRLAPREPPPPLLALLALPVAATAVVVVDAAVMADRLRPCCCLAREVGCGVGVVVRREEARGSRLVASSHSDLWIP